MRTESIRQEAEPMSIPPTITRVELGGSSDPTFIIKDGET
jgi:hypothetical protein